MKLRDWLSLSRMTQNDFAERLGVRRETVVRWCAEEFVPDMPMIVRIDEETAGVVTALDWAAAERRRQALNAATTVI